MKRTQTPLACDRCAASRAAVDLDVSLLQRA